MSAPWALCTIWLATAQAEERVPILRVEGPTLVVPIGANDGIRPGQTVEVYRTVSAVDPRTGRTLTDQFRVGSGVVTSTGDTLSQLHVPADLAVRLTAGDVVGLHPVAPVAATPKPTAHTPTRAEVRYTLTPEARAFQEAFDTAAGAPREDRLAVWTTWLENWPDTAVTSAVRDEVASLQKPMVEERPAPTVDLESAAPTLVPEHVRVPVVVTGERSDIIQSATLFYRASGATTYRHTGFQSAGDTAWSAEVPADAVLRPGLEWFVEVRDTGDTMHTVGGSAQAPASIHVREVASPRVIEDRSQATLIYEYVDFYAGSGADRYSHGEADFLYRIGLPVLYSMRLGAGTYRGVGGDTEDLDALGIDGAEAASEPVGYNFGYTELEFQLSPWFAVIGRGLVGIDYSGLAGGAEGRIRLGKEAGTSLDAGAARIGRIGTRYALGLDWNSVERVPMGASIEVTDFPGVARQARTTIENYGVRLIYDARYAFTDHVELGARVGWALRNIDHAGPSAGAQAVFSW